MSKNFNGFKGLTSLNLLPIYGPVKVQLRRGCFGADNDINKSCIAAGCVLLGLPIFLRIVKLALEVC